MIASMDDEKLYGPEFRRLAFGEAVDAGLLTDYKVLVLAVDEEAVARTFQQQLSDANNELELDDAAKIVGCWNGLAKRGLSEHSFAPDTAPMRRAVAFAGTIKASKKIDVMFAEISAHYVEAAGLDERGKSPGKQFGYIILPIGLPSGVPVAQALNDNKRFTAVWEVLQALRAHDERFNAMVNRISLTAGGYRWGFGALPGGAGATAFALPLGSATPGGCDTTPPTGLKDALPDSPKRVTDSMLRPLEAPKYGAFRLFSVAHRGGLSTSVPERSASCS